MTPTQARVGIIAALALAAGALPATAAPGRPIRFDQLSLEQGLSQSTVMDVLQDRRGYMWLATEDGLNRYDGYSFKVYRHDPADAASLPSSFVWDVEEDGTGGLWVATAGGLARLDRATERFTVKADLPASNVRALRFAAKDNVLWVGSRDQGLLRLELGSGQWRRFTHDAGDAGSLADDRVYALLVDRAGRLWVGTLRGVRRGAGRRRGGSTRA